MQKKPNTKKKYIRISDDKYKLIRDCRFHHSGEIIVLDNSKSLSQFGEAVWQTSHYRLVVLGFCESIEHYRMVYWDGESHAFDGEPLRAGFSDT